MEQEELDKKMLHTGAVPVLPTGPNGECEFHFSAPFATGGGAGREEVVGLMRDLVKGKAKVVPVEEEDEEEELRKLQAEMAM